MLVHVHSAAQFNLVFPHRTDPKLSGSQCKLSSPHSNAAVDLNGDCLAGTERIIFCRVYADVLLDLFLVCDESNGDKSYQIWVNNKDSGFSLAQSGRFPRGLQSVSFADIGKQKSTRAILSCRLTSL